MVPGAQRPEADDDLGPKTGAALQDQLGHLFPKPGWVWLLYPVCHEWLSGHPS